MRSRLALTLIEVVISIAILATLLVAVIEASLSVRSFTDQHENLLDLEMEGRQILNQVSSDLSNTTWFNHGTALPVAPPDTFGNRIEFLRIRNVSPGSTATGISRVDFTRPAARMQDWKDPLLLPAVTGLVVDEDYVTNGPGTLVNPVWETTALRSGDALTFDENRDLLNLRIYVYRVEPTSSGRGTLRRYYREGSATGPLVRDTHLGDLGRNVYSFSARVEGQRVILALELRRNPPGAAVVPGTPVTPQVSHFETIIAMRSIN